MQKFFDTGLKKLSVRNLLEIDLVYDKMARTTKYNYNKNVTLCCSSLLYMFSVFKLKQYFNS